MVCYLKCVTKMEKMIFYAMSYVYLCIPIDPNMYVDNWKIAPPFYETELTRSMKSICYGNLLIPPTTLNFFTVSQLPCTLISKLYKVLYFFNSQLCQGNLMQVQTANLARKRSQSFRPNLCQRLRERGKIIVSHHMVVAGHRDNLVNS